MTNPFEGMMQQAQKFQSTLKKMQDELSAVRIEGVSGAGMVKVIVNGNGEALQTIIDDAVYNEDKKVLEELICAAINSAKAKREKVKNERMQKILGGLGLPANFNFPFMAE